MSHAVIQLVLVSQGKTMLTRFYARVSHSAVVYRCNNTCSIEFKTRMSSARRRVCVNCIQITPMNQRTARMHTWTDLCHQPIPASLILLHPHYPFALIYLSVYMFFVRIAEVVSVHLSICPCCHVISCSIMYAFLTMLCASACLRYIYVWTDSTISPLHRHYIDAIYHHHRLHWSPLIIVYVFKFLTRLLTLTVSTFAIYLLLSPSLLICTRLSSSVESYLHLSPSLLICLHQSSAIESCFHLSISVFSYRLVSSAVGSYLRPFYLQSSNLNKKILKSGK